MTERFKGTIRDVSESDIPEVEAIYDLYWSGDFREKLSRRLREFCYHTPDSIEQGFRYFIAQEGGEVVGVAAFRKVPEHMREYTTTDNAAEFYVSAAKYKGRGIGSALRAERIKEARSAGFQEVVFYSGETHQDSWEFHDNSDFKRVGATTSPDGEEGYVWRMTLL